MNILKRYGPVIYIVPAALVVLAVGAAATIPGAPATAASVASVSTVAASTVTSAQIQSKLTSLQNDHDSWSALSHSDTAALSSQFAGTAPLSKSGVQFDPSSVQGWRVSSAVRIVTYHPLSGQPVEAQSSLTAFFDASGRVSNTVEIDLQELSSSSGQIETWLNGVLSTNKVVTNGGVVRGASRTIAQQHHVASGAIKLVSDVRTTYKRGDWWGNLNECLSNTGIASWVITAISIACAAICIATAGIGCIACIAAAAGGTGGVIGHCIVRANQRS